MRSKAFTLIELLVVVSLIALLLGLLLPVLGASRGAARLGLCGSNIRQLLTADLVYAADHEEHFVPAAEDVFDGYGGTKRWHGEREAAGVSADPQRNLFDPARGPLAPYLAGERRVRLCPSFERPIRDGGQDAFEAGTGGYGYNQAYVGGRYDLFGATPAAAARTAALSEVREPVATIMFTDAAFRLGPNDAGYLVEYSFCEPPLRFDRPGPPSMVRPTPSIHFRHSGSVASTAWVDGHVQPRGYGFTYPGYLGTALEVEGIGWFGPGDNALFDLR